MKPLLTTKEDAEMFVFWAVTLMCSMLRKGRHQLQAGKNNYCCLGVGVVCTVPENKIKLRRTTNIDKLKGTMEGTLPAYQPDTPKWLKNMSKHFAQKTGKYLSEINDDGNTSHKEIGELLLKTYEDELNQLL